MKRLLFFISLSLTLTETPKCKIYEAYDEEKQKCKNYVQKMNIMTKKQYHVLDVMKVHL